MKRRYKHQHLQSVYEACIRLAADKGSEMYGSDGRQRTGSRIRECFWAGANGRVCLTAASTQARAAYMAGRDFARGER